MGLYDQPLEQIQYLLKQEDILSMTDYFHYTPEFNWPAGGEKNFVFKQDTAIELGPPGTESVSFLFWTNQLETINDGRITVLGPELSERKRPNLDFGQIVIVGIENRDPADEYLLFQQLEEVRYRLDLEGYMKRGVSQFLREWSRISREAMDKGFGLQTLGQGLIGEYRKQASVSSVEIILTSESRIVKALKPIAGKALRIFQAVHKMVDETLMDCETCDYTDLCKEVDELKKIRKRKLRDKVNG